jgi:predicted ABC-type ATPase
MKTYNIIAGVNGVGKSSFTGVIKLRENLGIIIDIDKLSVTQKISNIEAGKLAVDKISYALENGITFTQETTLSGKKTISTVRTAREKGFFIRLYYIGLDTPGESLKRIENRVLKGGHNIAENDVLRRFKNRFEVLREIVPYCDEVLFFDNDNGFAEIAEYKSSELVIKTQSPPPWLSELQQYL